MNRLWISALRLALTAAFLIVAAGCAASNMTDEPAHAESVLLTPGQLEALRGGSTSKALTGAEFLAQSNCFTELESLRLNVTITAVQRSGKELGWAAYRFSGINGLPQSLQVNCGVPVPGSQYFVAVASQADKRWHTFGPFSEEEALIDLSQVAAPVSSSGDLLFAVMARGHNVVLLHSSTLMYGSPEV